MARRKSRAPAPPARKPMRISNALLAQDAPNPLRHGGYKPRKIELPRVPFNVDRPKQETPAMAMDDAGGVPFGSFLGLNTAAGLGAFGLYFPGYPYLAELAQRSEFRQPVETIAKEMTRKWIVFKSKGEGDKSERIKGLEEEFEKFKLQALFRKAIELEGFYGLGQIYISIKGQEDARAEPLLIDKATIEKDSLQGFKTIEPMWVTPLVWDSMDPTHPYFYRPESWMVLGRKTHESRLMDFRFREVPDIIKPAYNFGGISLSQLIEPYVARWLQTVTAVNRLISNFSIVNLQTDLSQILEGGDDSSNIVKRMALFNKNRDNQGSFLTDKEREALQILMTSLAGLSELQAQAQEHQAAPTHLPLVVLTGITPAGLNASSDSEIQIFHDWNHSMQEACNDNVKRCMKLVQLNRWGDVDEDVVHDWVPLKELDGEAASRVYKTKADAGIAYIDAGVIRPEEERKRLATDPDSGYINLDAEDVPDPPMPVPMPGEEGGGGAGDEDDDDQRAAA